jgi:DNA-binding Lrp family transcriptional regulator
MLSSVTEERASAKLSTMPMDDLDRRILDALQNEFPLAERPFDVLAERLGLEPEQLWRRVERLREQGVIRRLGASLDSRRLGYRSTLAAVRVAPELVGRAAGLIGRYPEVTHSYLREHPFNIWFTLIAADDARIETILNEIRAALSLAPSDILNLPVRRLFKLDARFRARPQAAPPGSPESRG